MLDERGASYGFDLDETLTCGIAWCFPAARREAFAAVGLPLSAAVEREIREGNLYVRQIVDRLCAGALEAERWSSSMPSS